MKTGPPLWYTLQAVLSWIFEEILLAAIVLWLLPHFFNIKLPVWALAILMIALAAVSAAMYRFGRTTFFIKPRVAADNIIGSVGTVTTPLTPEGYVKVQGVLWKAMCPGLELDIGDEVEVTGVEGLKLIVKRKTKDSEPKP